METKLLGSGFLAASLILGGCGGGGSTDSRAEITSANAKELAISATSALKVSVDGQSSNPFGARNAAGTMARLAASTSTDCSDYSTGSTGTVTFITGTSSVEVNFSCSDLNGTFNMSFSPDFANWTTFEATFDDFTDGSQTFDGSFECSRPSSTSININCSYSYSGLTGIDSGSYSISGSAFTGDNISGYSGTVTVTDSDRGSVTITASNIIYDDACAFDVPVSGTLSMAGSEGSSATVTFNSCNDATVVVDGNSILITWSTI